MTERPRQQKTRLKMDDRYSAHQLTELKVAFSLFDLDKDGAISVEEVKHVVKDLGYTDVSDCLIEEIFEIVDIDGDGLIDFEEFVRMIEHRSERQSEDAEMRGLFAAFDKDGNGFIDFKELKATMLDVGMPVSDSDVKDMMKEIGVELDGRIYYEDFVRMMTGKIGKAQRKMSCLAEEPGPLIPVDEEKEDSQETRDLRVAFAMFDKNGDGVINTEELEEVIRSLSIDTTTTEVKRMIKKVDLDGDGNIDFREFQELLVNFQEKRSFDPDLEMQQAFQVFDRDGSGYIDAKEIRVTMHELGVVVTSDDVAAMLQEAGVQLDGRLYYNDFVRMMQRRFEKSMDEHKAHDKYHPEQLKVLKTAFMIFDKDRDSTISHQEFRKVMKGLGQHSSEKQLKLMFQQIDTDGNGLISFDEFVTMMEQYADPERQAKGREMRALFNIFDKDHNGYIDFKELKSTMNGVGLKVSSKEVQAMMKEIGIKKNGKIYYQDFIRLMIGRIKDVQKETSTVKKTSASPLRTQNQRPEDTDLRELKTTFGMFDKDGDGSITSQELLEVIRSMGFDISTSKVKEMIRKVDTDGNGKIEWEEFRDLMVQWRPHLLKIHHKERTTEEEETRQAFRVFDKDNNGYIDAPELRSTMEELGVHLTETDVAAMMKEAGVEVDGRIYYEDFLKIMFGQIIKPIPKMGAVSQAHIQELKMVFAMFDQDGDGAITPNELHCIMRSLGFTADDEMLKAMIDKFDYDGSGTLEFDEFMRMMTKRNKRGVSRWERTREKASEPECWRAFKVFDRDRSGFITALELKSTMLELGISLTEDDIKLMIQEADNDGDGRINYKEFTNMMKGNFMDFLGPPSTLVEEEDPALESLPTDNVEPVMTEPALTLYTPTSVTTSPARSSRPTSGLPPPVATSFTSSSKSRANMEGRTLSGQGSLSSQVSPYIIEKLKASHVDIKRQNELRCAFNAYDPMGRGVIPASELSNVINLLNVTYSPNQVNTILQKAGSVAGNGTVDFQEFLRMMSRSKSRHDKSEEMRRKVEEDEMRQAFKVFDIDGNGYIDAHELRLTMQNLGENLTEEDVKAMIKEADTNGDGKIDYEEFIKMMYAK